MTAVYQKACDGAEAPGCLKLGRLCGAGSGVAEDARLTPDRRRGAAHKTKSSLMLKLDLDGFWYNGMLTEMKTASNTRPLRGMIHLGYDATGKQPSLTPSLSGHESTLRPNPSN